MNARILQVLLYRILALKPSLKISSSKYRKKVLEPENLGLPMFLRLRFTHLNRNIAVHDFAQQW